MKKLVMAVVLAVAGWGFAQAGTDRNVRAPVSGDGVSCTDRNVRAPGDKVVVLSAHPDDIIACAGFMLKTKDVFEWHVIDFTKGELGLGEAGFKDGSTARRRMREETNACAKVNAKIHWLGGIDGHLYATEALCDKLVKMLEELKPRAVILHWPLDHHPDHVMTYALSMKALNRLDWTTDDKVELYFMDEVYQPRDFKVRYSVDITDILEERDSLIRCYECQSPEDNIRFLTKMNYIRSFNTRQGVGWNSERYVECYGAFGDRPAGLKSIFDEVPVKKN